MKHLRESVMHVAEAWLGWEAIKGLGEYVKSTIEAVSASTILAERVGFSSEAFQKLAYAAKFAHIDQEQLAVSLGQMSKRLGEVAMTGEGPAVNALKRFGLTAQQLVALGPEKAFQKIIEVMEHITNPMERSAIAVELFGKAGQGMVNLVARGGPELKAMGDEASRLGIAMSAIDNQKALEAEESMIKLSAAASGFANLLIAEIAPYLTLVIDKYLEWAYGGTKSMSFLTQATDWVVAALGTVVDTVHLLEAGFWGLAATIQTFVSNSLTPIRLLEEAIRRLEGLVTGKDRESWFAVYDAQLTKNIDTSIAKTKEAFEKIGQGKATVRTLVDDIQEAATARATKKAAAAAKFIEPGAIAGKTEEPKFAGALELGSKEAYSATIANQRRTGDTKQDQLLEHAKTTAESGKDSVILLKQINDALTKGAGNFENALGKL